MNRGITHSELEDMLKKYNIGKKPLSSLLGWGETTVLLYLNMEEIPQNDYTERLYKLYSSSAEYFDTLLKNHEKISHIAFKKSFKAVAGNVFENKLLGAAQYVFDHAEDYISKSRIENILMWAQIISMVLYDSPVFNDSYQPTRGNYPYKSVITCMDENNFFIGADKQYSELISNIYENDKETLSVMLSDREKSILAFTYEMFGWYGEKALNQLLAAERFRLCGPPTQNRKRIVSNDMIKKTYQNVFEQAKIKKLSDVENFMAKRMEALRKRVPN